MIDVIASRVSARCYLRVQTFMLISAELQFSSSPLRNRSYRGAIAQSIPSLGVSLPIVAPAPTAPPLRR